MDNNLIRCSQISVDCVANDPVDIRCGGPEYLGFDFFVKKEETEYMQLFIRETLKVLEIPLTNMYASCKNMKKPSNKLWTKERIVEAISKDANYLKEEASRNYGSYRRR